MPHATRPGDVLADRYRLVDLLSESGDGRFWRAHDRVLERHVAIHVIRADDPRAPGLMAAARRSATVHDRRILRVLDADVTEHVCYVVNEWGWGTSLDIVVAGTGPLGPRRAAWLVSEVADSIAAAHAAGVPHGRLNPENVLIDRAGGVRLIGFCVDAALHGVSTENLGHDVTDLAGLLYCALTTRWAGVSGSLVEAAPREHGELLRPRQVRAGVPRPLDALCDELLHPGHRARGLPEFRADARGIHAFLSEFVGDPSGMAAALVASTPPVLPDEELVVLPPVPEMVPHDVDPAPPVSESASASETEAMRDGAVPDKAVAEPPPDAPTEAGLPIFGEDGDDVSWLERRTTPVPPPPPFDEPPERPLFAPEPSNGAPRRVAREGAAATSGISPGDEFWPFAGHASGGRHPGGPAAAPRATDSSVPGRSWNRLASIVAVVVLLLVAVTVAINLGRGKTPLGAEPDGDVSPSDSPSVSRGVVLKGVTAAALDPLGTDAGEENNEDAPLAVDGDPSTTWDTEGYNDQFGPRGLKTGVGLSLDLGGARSVTGVDLTFEGAPTDVSIYYSQVPPEAVDDIRLLASGTARRTALSLQPDEPTRARYLVIWLTRLPQESDGRFRGHVAEVAVRGG
ncbi:MAG: protein kinase family protein [Nocardioides sp.]